MTSSLLKNIFSLGAAGRIDDAIEGLGELQSEYEAKRREVDAKREAVNLALLRVVDAKQGAHGSLKRISVLTASLSARERTFLTEQAPIGGVRSELGHVEATLKAGDIAIAAAKGSGAALSTAAGAWALVGVAGTASSGTAIASLGGAAATNATLAWFGGGSLAAGGTGMAGGALALGGLVAVPALILMGVFAHVSANEKIAEIKAHGLKLVRESEKAEQTIVVLSALAGRAEELVASIGVAQRGFEHILERAERALRRTWYQRAWRWLCGVFGGPQHSAAEVQAIAEAGAAATALAKIIDQPVMDGNGVPQ